jgi:hypothetical protein
MIHVNKINDLNEKRKKDKWLKFATMVKFIKIYIEYWITYWICFWYIHNGTINNIKIRFHKRLEYINYCTKKKEYINYNFKKIHKIYSFNKFYKNLHNSLSYILKY